MNNPIGVRQIEEFAQSIIKKYGFRSTSMTGFSCFIPDPGYFSEGILIWNFSNSYSRFETQFHKFFTDARRDRMVELGVDLPQYLTRMADATILYRNAFLRIPGAKAIGSGINNFPGKGKIFNVGLEFDRFPQNSDYEEKLAQVLCCNEVVRFIETIEYWHRENRE